MISSRGWSISQIHFLRVIYSRKVTYSRGWSFRARTVIWIHNIDTTCILCLFSMNVANISFSSCVLYSAISSMEANKSSYRRVICKSFLMKVVFFTMTSILKGQTSGYFWAASQSGTNYCRKTGRFFNL